MRYVALGAAVLALVCAGAAALAWGRWQDARLALHNERAAHDTTRVVLTDSLGTVTERLVFQSREALRFEATGDTLTDRLAALARAHDERGVVLLRTRVVLDSLRAVTTHGTVTTLDSVGDVRELRASLDTLGIRAAVRAIVPRPPAPAVTTWDVAIDPVRIVQSVTRTPDGAAVWRAAVDARARVLADTIVIRAPASGALQVSIPLGLSVTVGAFGVGMLLGVLLGG